MGPELVQVFTDGAWGFGGHGAIGNAAFSAIVVNGTSYPHGLGTPPPNRGTARVTYSIDRKFKRFSGKVGINDTSKNLNTGVVFQIKADGREIWHSERMRSGSQIIAFDLDVKDIKHIELNVECTGSNDDAHAVWLDPVVTP